VEGGSKSLGQRRVSGINTRGDWNKHGREDLYVFGKTAGQISDPDGAPPDSAEVGLSHAAFPALPAIGRPDNNPGAFLGRILLSSPVADCGAGLVAQYDSIGQQPAFDQGVIRPAKACVRHLYQDSILSRFRHGDFFDGQSFAFSVDSGFIFFVSGFRSQVTRPKRKI